MKAYEQGHADGQREMRERAVMHCKERVELERRKAAGLDDSSVLKSVAETHAMIVELIENELRNLPIVEQPAAQVAAEEASIVIPPEVLDLVRFMCSTWAELDRWAYQNCDADALAKYPVIQGTSNQIALQRIGEQPYDDGKIRKAVEWMQRNSSKQVA